MKEYNIDIHEHLKGVKIKVKNGALFERCIISGTYKSFEIQLSEKDAERVKKFAVKYADDKSSNKGNWYAHCNGYAMDLMVLNKGSFFSINTYRPYGRSSK